MEPSAEELLDRHLARFFTLYYNDTREKKDRIEEEDARLFVPTETPKELSPEVRMEAEIEMARAAEAADKARRGV